MLGGNILGICIFIIVCIKVYSEKSDAQTGRHVYVLMMIMMIIIRQNAMK